MSPWGLGSVTVLAQPVPGFAGILLEAVVTCLATIDTEDLEAKFVSSVGDMMFRISKRWVQQSGSNARDPIKIAGTTASNLPSSGGRACGYRSPRIRQAVENAKRDAPTAKK